MKTSHLFFVAATMVVALAACDDDGGTPMTPRADVLAGDTFTPSPTPTPPAAVASCLYTNTFSSTAECREYAGTWTLAAAEADCAVVFFNSPGVLSAGPCVVDDPIGRCVVGDLDADGYATISTGDASACDGARLGCETFASGTFTPDPVCDVGNLCAAPTPATASTFHPPFLDCRAPLAGETAGKSDGLVCTQTMISGSTEVGRHFPSYADCSVVRRQRPYYGDAPEVPDVTGDPRLADADYMGELAWVTEQARASACTCCHEGSSTPDGAAVWDLEAGPLWIDTVSDEALAMLVGLTDSRYFGYYPPEENNGFDRSQTGLPTTDVARLQAFGRVELTRRGLTEAEARELAPFAPFFRELVEYEPGPCPEGLGVDASGAVQWDGVSARYVTILEDGSASPGVAPNWDLPEGTIWAVAADHEGDAMGCGFQFGDVPAGAVQRYPADGEAPAALVSGRTYYLHVQQDMAFPLTRCTFVAP